MKSGVLKFLSVVGVAGAIAAVNHISTVKTYAEITPEFTERYLTEERRVIEYGKEINEASVLKNDNVEYLGFKGNDKYMNLQYELTDKNIFGKPVTKEVVVPFKVEDTMAPFITLRENKVEIMQHLEFNPEDNIISVKDFVDGSLEYNLEHNIDVATPGIYTATVSAVDRNGLKKRERISSRSSKTCTCSKTSSEASSETSGN